MEGLGVRRATWLGPFVAFALTAPLSSACEGKSDSTSTANGDPSTGGDAGSETGGNAGSSSGSSIGGSSGAGAGSGGSTSGGSSGAGAGSGGSTSGGSSGAGAGGSTSGGSSGAGAGSAGAGGSASCEPVPAQVPTEMLSLQEFCSRGEGTTAPGVFRCDRTVDEATEYGRTRCTSGAFSGLELKRGCGLVAIGTTAPILATWRVFDAETEQLVGAYEWTDFSVTTPPVYKYVAGVQFPCCDEVETSTLCPR